MKKSFSLTNFARPCLTALAFLQALLLVSACSQRQTLPGDGAAQMATYQQRVEDLGNRDQWTLRARLAVDDGEDGGSGSFSWSRNRNHQSMSFHGAMGRGAWRLKAEEGSAELALADGTVQRASSVSQLVEEQLGYALPVDYLAWWVRGLAAPGAVDELELNGDGAPEFLRQQSWVIQFERYRAFDGVLMPIKIKAKKGDWTVKLAVRTWQWDEV